jgi:hypothetical protein
MKTFQQIGAEVGELVQRKNVAYGSSFEKCGAYMRLLYPDGVRPDQYEDVLLLARDFDKNMRIANHRDAFGENPYSDKIGYAILGYYLHQSNEEESTTTCPGDANGAVPRSRTRSATEAHDSARPNANDSTEQRPIERTEPAHLPQPDGCSIPLDTSTAAAAPVPASASAEGHQVARAILEALDASGSKGGVLFHRLPYFPTSSVQVNALLDRMQSLGLVGTRGHYVWITDHGAASLRATRLFEGISA